MMRITRPAVQPIVLKELSLTSVFLALKIIIDCVYQHVTLEL